MSGIPWASSRCGRRTASDRSGDGKDVEEDKEEAAYGRDKSEGEGEEDATGGCTKKNVVAEEKGLVGVVVRSSHYAWWRGFHGDAHLRFRLNFGEIEQD